MHKCSILFVFGYSIFVYMETPPQLSYRKIIHIDMDAFYASVEQRDNPELRGIPLVVGGLPEGRGGVVATASYEARKFGIRSAMSSKQALQLCPHAIFVRPRFPAYKEASQRIREIFSRYTDLIEPLSLDEAYLDVTNDKLNIGSAIEIAKQIKQAIKDELQLTASAGVSINKFVAKIASDINKPDGLTFIGPSSIESFMEKLPVEKFYGVGKVTTQKMKNLGLHLGADLKKLTHDEIVQYFGKPGRFYYQIVRGIDDRETELDKIAKLVADRLQRYDLKGRTITLKIKYNDFKQITRNKSFLSPVADLETISTTAKQLLAATNPQDKRIRLLGISLSNFGYISDKPIIEKSSYQLKLFIL